MLNGLDWSKLDTLHTEVYCSNCKSLIYQGDFIGIYDIIYNDPHDPEDDNLHCSNCDRIVKISGLEVIVNNTKLYLYSDGIDLYLNDGDSDEYYNTTNGSVIDWKDLNGPTIY